MVHVVMHFVSCQKRTKQTKTKEIYLRLVSDRLSNLVSILGDCVTSVFPIHGFSLPVVSKNPAFYILYHQVLVDPTAYFHQLGSVVSRLCNDLSGSRFLVTLLDAFTRALSSLLSDLSILLLLPIAVIL